MNFLIGFNVLITLSVRGAASFPLRGAAKRSLVFLSSSRHYSSFMFFTNDCISFPVSNAFSVIGNGWTLININPIWYACAVASSTITLPVRFVLVSQEQIKFTSVIFISQDILINSFMMKCYDSITFKPTGNLLWTPIFFKITVPMVAVISSVNLIDLGLSR